MSMPAFDGNSVGEVSRVFRPRGFGVDIGDPLIEVQLTHSTVIVRTWRDGHVLKQNAWKGQRIKPGDAVAEISAMSGPMEKAVFIAYRHTDSTGHTGRIYDGVVHDIGRRQVFRDIGSLIPGLDFVKQVGAALQRMRLMLLVIGPGWLDSADQNGQRRLDDPADLHRVEIRTAIQRGTPILPVLVNRGRMPRGNQLPGDLQPLERQLALEISDERWDFDADRLREAIAGLLDRLSLHDANAKLGRQVDVNLL
jgi:hypothetical protein